MFVYWLKFRFMFVHKGQVDISTALAQVNNFVQNVLQPFSDANSKCHCSAAFPMTEFIFLICLL